MDAVKKAIRSALQKGDANDRAFREKVYRQAFAALERSMQARPDLAAEEVQQRREQIKAAIIEIEREYIPREAPQPSAPTPPPPGEPSPSSAEEVVPERREPDFMPRIERAERLQLRDEPTPDYSPLGEVRRPVAARRRRPIALLVAILALVAVIGLGLWWIVGGIPRPAEQGGVGAGGEIAGTPPPMAEGAASDRDWITVFSPTDPTTASTAAGASAEAMSEAGESFLRIGARDPDGAVTFDVGQGVLEQLAGGRAVFSLNARASEGETQISISCDFAALGGCGRTRYEVGDAPSEYLFEIQLPDRQPTGGGRISIAPDVAGQGRLLDVFSLRVSIAE
ncbi:hypothetical protein [Chelativorans sp. AA-79]|uniref:hypothetical protein n=1 Tax=Chelativorans sp. AA-79 TaxID=3028735 RepID=UPI0023F7A746|nr:hypothetical protein [Chelativorans sp. AA-79]WEX09099.1 hypothetical protein PVE73_24160 [Chelativorans sp. AA-79]